MPGFLRPTGNLALAAQSQESLPEDCRQFPVIADCAHRCAPRPRHLRAAVCRTVCLLLDRPADLSVRTENSLRSRVRSGDRPRSRLCSIRRATLVELTLPPGDLVDPNFDSLRTFLATALGRALLGRPLRSLEVGRTHRSSSTGLRADVGLAAPCRREWVYPVCIKTAEVWQKCISMRLPACRVGAGSVRMAPEAGNPSNPKAGSRPAGWPVQWDQDVASASRANIERSQCLRWALTGGVDVLKPVRNQLGLAFWLGPGVDGQ